MVKRLLERVASLHVKGKQDGGAISLDSSIRNDLFHRFFQDFFGIFSHQLGKMAAEVIKCKVDASSCSFFMNKSIDDRNEVSHF